MSRCSVRTMSRKAKHWPATQGHGRCDVSDAMSPPTHHAEPSPWRWTGPFCPTQAVWTSCLQESLVPQGHQPAPQGWASRHQGHDKAWEELCQVPGQGHAAEVVVGAQIKEGNSQLYKCSAAQKWLPCWLLDYCSSFWPLKPDATA